MGQEISADHFHKRDFDHFERALAEETALLAEWFETSRFSSESPRIGLELEAWLLDPSLRPAPCNDLFLERLNHPMVVPELACFNVEINSAPQSISDRPFSRLEEGVSETWRQGEAVARSMERSLSMIGTLPTLVESDLTLDNMSRMQRYHALNEQVMRMRKGAPLQFRVEGREQLHLDHQDVMMEAATTSLQIHLQVPLSQSVDAFNHAVRASAAMVALCANAPYLFGQALWEDSRIPIFEQAVNVDRLSHRLGKGRVGFGRGYADQSLFEFFRENREHYPVMLPMAQSQPIERLAHLMLHNGTIWRWNRPLIGFDPQGVPHLRIEHRVASAGPTLLDVVANTAFFTGLVMGMLDQPQRAAEELSFSEAKNNFYRAARYGLDSAILWSGGREVYLKELMLQELIPLARVGMEHLGLPASEWQPWLELIEKRVMRGQNGSRWQQRWVAQHGVSMEGLMAAYLERQQSGVPVHEWSLSV